MDSATLSIDALRSEVQKLRARYDEEPSHSRHVEKLALQIFDGFAAQKSDLKTEPRNRLLLECAALLHDIGWSQTPDGRGHHKQSAKLIRGHTWSSLELEEVEIIALVARYHRKSIPKTSHKDFTALSDETKRRVRFLGGILRVADALDRTHISVVQQVSCDLKPDEATIIALTRGPWDEERKMFFEKKDLLELALESPVRVVEA